MSPASTEILTHLNVITISRAKEIAKALEENSLGDSERNVGHFRRKIVYERERERDLYICHTVVAFSYIASIISW